MNFKLKGNTTVISSLRHSGKSELCRMLMLSQQEDFDHVFVISCTNKCNNFYDWVNPNNILTEFSDEWIDLLIKKCEELNLGKTKNSIDSVETLLVLDDCASSSNFKGSRGLEKLFTLGRHYHLSLIVLTQRIRSLSTTCRINTNFLICGLLNQQSIKLLLDEYTLGKISKKEFETTYRESTLDYGFLIINNSAGNSDSLNCYYSSIRVPKDKIKVL